MNPNKFTGHIAIVGAGAVGGFVGGRLAQAGYNVTLIDPWADHVSAMTQRGLTIRTPAGDTTCPIHALHTDDASGMARLAPVDIAFICVKLYDTEWAIRKIAPCLAASGYVVTLQNSLVEEVIAGHVGWDKTVGCIGSGMYVALGGPGLVTRSKSPSSQSAPVFYVGEITGEQSTRIEQLAGILQRADTTQITGNLWGLRWAKLTANAMTSGFSAVCGLGLKETFRRPECRRLMQILASEAIRVGMARNYHVEPVFGLPAAVWLAADEGNADARLKVDGTFQTHYDTVTDTAVSGTAQDLKKGRKTEVDFMNGYVAAQAQALKVSTPLHHAVAQLLADIELNRQTPGEKHLHALAARFPGRPLHSAPG